MRTASIARDSKDTKVRVAICVDGGPVSVKDSLFKTSDEEGLTQHQKSGGQDISVRTGLGFLDHMLHALAKHSGWSLLIECTGDSSKIPLECGVALGSAFKEAMGSYTEVHGTGTGYAPLDEALSQAEVDLTKKSACANVNLHLVRKKIGDVGTEMLPQVLQGFAMGADISIYVNNIRGMNDHHKSESGFKSLALAFKEATLVK